MTDEHYIDRDCEQFGFDYFSKFPGNSTDYIACTAQNRQRFDISLFNDKGAIGATPVNFTSFVR